LSWYPPSACNRHPDPELVEGEGPPARLPDLLKHPNAVRAMLQMKKLDIGELERAAQT
jgi:hypothetical protein